LPAAASLAVGVVDTVARRWVSASAGRVSGARLSATVSMTARGGGPSAADGNAPTPPRTAMAVTDIDVAATAILP
jgi:hypothetical protein